MACCCHILSPSGFSFPKVADDATEEGEHAWRENVHFTTESPHCTGVINCCTTTVPTKQFGRRSLKGVQPNPVGPGLEPT